MKYLHNRGLSSTPTTARSGPFWVTARWTSPSRWAPSRWPPRENLDNLIFVINCNLQRLDGPVRGNGKIIQELEAVFRGAGWNVIKVVWGSNWDPLLARDQGLLRKRMEEAVDGEYQAYPPATAPSFAGTSSASTRSSPRWWPTCRTRRSGA